MQPRVSVITLAVTDLERSLAFYRDGFGFPTEGIVGRDIEHGAVAFFDLQQGVRLAVWPASSMAHDAGVSVTAPPSVTLGHNVATADDVDSIMSAAAEFGAAIVKPAAATDWGGYAGYIADPDGHLWEIVFNPAWADEFA